MVTKILKSSFIGGELSSKLQNRFDFQGYQNSAKFIENFYITKEGNLNFRNGTYFYADTGLNVQTNTREVKLAQWIRSDSLIYLLQFSNLSLKIYKNGVLIKTLTTVYTTSDLSNIQFDMLGNIFYIVDGIKTVYILTLTLTEDFTFTPIDFAFPPFDEENTTAITISSSATALGNTTLTASASLFDATYLNKYIKIRNSGTGAYGYVLITGITNSTTATGTIKMVLPFTTATLNWSVSVSPSAIIFYQSRLWFAKNNRIYGSRTQSNDGAPRFNDFTTGTSEDNAVSLVNTMFKTPILWLKSTDRNLIAGTSTTLFQLNSTSTNGYLSPINLPVIVPFSNTGCKSIVPLQENNNVFFVGIIGIQNDTGSRLNSIRFDWASDGYQVLNTNLLNDEINKEGIVDLCYTKGYDDILYCLKSNGEISGLNYNPEQQINGWFRLNIAGFNRQKGFDNNDGVIESITALRQLDGSDLLVMCVRRYINGSIKRYLEYITNSIKNIEETEYYTGNEELDKTTYLYYLNQLQLNYNYLDCASIYNGLVNKNLTISQTSLGLATITSTDYTFLSTDVGREIHETFNVNLQNGVCTIVEYVSATEVKVNVQILFNSTTITNFIITTNTINGLGYLEGKTITTFIDGGAGQDYTVSSGTINLQYQGAFIIVGLKYKGIVKTLNFNIQSQDGTSSDLQKHINVIDVYFYNTMNCKIGTSLYKTDNLFIGPSQMLGKAPYLFNGFKSFIIKDSPSYDKYIYILKDDATPCNIQFINMHINYK